MRQIKLVSFFLIIIIPACRIVHVYEGKSIIISRTIDTSLNDSALIFGYVYSAIDEISPEPFAEIWIDGKDTKTTADKSGYFYLKIPAGLCTIKCKGKYSNDDEIEEIKDLTVIKNEKIELKFFIGITIE